MPALMTWGGVALAVLGLLVTFLGLPDRAAGLSMGSDLIQAGATLFAGGLIVAALGLVLRGLRDVADRVEEAAFGFGTPRNTFNDDERDEAPMPLPRAARNAPQAEAPEADDYQPEPRVAARDVQPRTPRPPRGREPQAAPEPVARAPRQPVQPVRPPREAAAEPADEFPSEMPQAPGDHREPRWLRAQAQAQADGEPPAPAAVPQSGRPTRGPASAPVNPLRRDAPPRPRLQPEPLPEEEVTASVVRSGIIGGMAYTLYSDGSIEAELPIGTVRFNSLGELQEHVKRAGAEADGDFRSPAGTH
jgi:hypothetical protein